MRDEQAKESNEIQVGKSRSDGKPVLFLPPSWVAPAESPLTAVRSVAVELGTRVNAAWLISGYVEEAGWDIEEFLAEVRQSYHDEKQEEDDDPAEGEG